ncbi:formate dehydrogenase subunit alpha [Halobaculum roseum]|uniref:Formate dehydrogenase subunit alpha n=1 Tax=Halobaculum roseum TaxID=2175149 RepID=A0ABD5MQH4_9EURY|nr:formate dehydrogenase subunit alpha [Halobaculum roseum]QZY04499.1 formate dehydrogenase subunit alpha [Halobaculum roseum]
MSDSDRTSGAAESICPFCGVGCGIEYDPSTDGARGWAGPVNTRAEVCPKGVAAWDAVEDPDRLTTPLVREDGELVEATWADALDRIERCFAGIVAADGPDALAFFASSNCTNEENYVLQKLVRLLGTNNVDNCARLCHSSTVAAMRDRLGAGAMTNSLDDVGEADAFLVVGANPAENHPVIFRSYLLPAIRNGTALIVVDPRETATAEAADVHLAVRPGYDIRLLNALGATIVAEDRIDRSFCADRVSGLDEYRTFAAGLDVPAAAADAGVDVGSLREAARTYANADSAAIFSGMGLSQHHYGTANVHALLNLALVTGNLGRRGAGVNPLRGQNNVQGAGDVGALPDLLPGARPVTDDAARAELAAEWDVEGIDLPAEPGLTEVEATHAFGETVRGAFVLGENPAVTEPNATRVADALDSLDCLVVQDLFVTETVEHADVVLPGSAWAERGGTVTNTDRQVLRMRPNTVPPGDARRDLEVLCELGSRLTNEPGAFTYDRPESVFEELTRVTPQYSGMTYDEIGTDSQRWPFQEDAEAGTTVLHEETFATGARHAPLRIVEHVEPADAVDDDDLVLTTGRVIEHFNSGALTRRSDRLVRMAGPQRVQIHPDDAANRGIADDDRITVESERGAVSAIAEVTPAVGRGRVFATFHTADPLVNTLTGDALDPVAKIPEYKHSAVRVRVSGDQDRS